MSLIDEFAAHLGPGRTLYTRARGTRFRAYVAGDVLVVESERSGRKAFPASIVMAAAEAIAAGAPPLEDRAVQVARSWVGAIQDSLRGQPNAARNPKAPASVRGVRQTAARQTVRRASSTARATRTGAAAVQSSRPRTARRAAPGASLPRPRPDAATVAREIGLEIARALASGQLPPAAQIESVVLEQIRAQVAVANEERERLRLQLETAEARVSDAEARAAAAERQASAWQARAVAIPGLGTVAIAAEAPAAGPSTHPDVAALLRDAVVSWRSAPSGSVASSRSALEQTIRSVAGRLPTGRDLAGVKFADVLRSLIDNDGAPFNLPRPDLYLARALYDRSSKAGHGVAGWRATPSEALLMLAGVAALVARARLQA